MSSVPPLRRSLLRRPLLLVLSVFAFVCNQAFAYPSGPAVQFAPTINGFAGTGNSGDSGDEGQAASAAFQTPSKVAVDAAGNVYVADTYSNRVRKIDTTGKITTIAGNGTEGFSGDLGHATAAQLDYPQGIAVDSAGNVYISDSVNNRIRKVDTNGMITTIAGTGEAGFSGDAGPATAAMLNHPAGIAVDAAGTLYVADYYNNRIRMIGTNGFIYTIAGTGTGTYNVDEGQATTVNIFYPVSVALDGSNHLYIGDFLNHRLRKLYLSTGYIKTVAGTGVDASGPAGDGGDASSATVSYPADITVDSAGNIYYADSGLQRIRKITPGGLITSIAGNGTGAYSGDGGPAVMASFYGPTGIALDSKGTIYIADQGNHVVRAISANTTVATVTATTIGQSINSSVAVLVNRDMIFKSISIGGNNVGGPAAEFQITPGIGCPADGFQTVTGGTACLFNVTFHPVSPGHRTASLVFVDTDGRQYTLALAGDATGPQVVYSPTFPNPATMTLSTGLNHPTALVFDNAGNGFIADAGRVQEVVNLGQLVNLNTQVDFATPSPSGLATDAQGNLYISDATTTYVTKVTPAHTEVLTGQYVFGTASQISVEAEGTSLSNASGIAATDRGDLYIADKGNSRVVKVTAEGVATVVNTGTITLDSPEGVAVDSKGNVFIADVDHIVKVDTNGGASLVSTGGLTLGHAKGVAVDPVGNLYIADSTNKKLIRITADGTASVVQTTGISFDPVRGPVIVDSTDNVDSITTNGLYLATSDSEANTVTVAIMAMAAPVSFSDTQVGHDSTDGTKTVTVQNVGNAPLTLSTASSGSNPSYPAGFLVDDNASQLCAAGNTLNAGNFCNIAAKFHPTQAGLQSGSITLTATMDGDTALPLYPISVSGNALPGLNHFSITGAPVNSDAGTPFNVTVTAMDGATPSGPVTDYTGTVHFKSQDAAANLPEDYTFTTADHGAHTFQVTLKTPGSQIVTVYDTSNQSVRADATVQVNAGAPASITLVSGQGQSATVGGYFPQNLVVKVLDQNNNPVPNVTVHYATPTSGPGLTASGSYSETTDVNGEAYFYATANGIAGSYQVVASVDGVDTPVTFTLTNTAGATATALVATPSSGATYGQSVTLTATVTPSGYISPSISRSPALPRTAPVADLGPATGTVTFFDGTRQVGTATLGGDTIVVGNSRGIAQPRRPGPVPGTSATASLTITAPAGGDHSYTAVYAGDTNFSTSQTLSPTLLTIGQAAAVLTGPATQPVQVGSGQAGNIVVTVASQSGAAGLAVPTGSISYQLGTNGLQQAQVTNGQATLQVPSTLAVGSYSIQATYSGDSNYLAVTTPTTIQVSVVNTVPADFSLTANPTSLTIKAGDTGHATFTFTPVGGFKGTITFSCGNLPAGVTCTFAPPTLTADGSNTVQTSQLTITTQKLVSANFFIPGALLGGLLFWQRRRFNLRKAQVLMLILGVAVIGGMVGCGSSGGPQTNASISQVTVTANAQATGGGTGTLAHTATFTLNITN